MGEYPSPSKDSKYGIYLTTSQKQLTYHNKFVTIHMEKDQKKIANWSNRIKT